MRDEIKVAISEAENKKNQLLNQLSEIETLLAKLKANEVSVSVGYVELGQPQVAEEPAPEPVLEPNKPVLSEEPTPEPVLNEELEPNKPVLSEELEGLKYLLYSDAWPAAVDPSLICDVNSEQDKEDRAEGILDLIIDMHLENLSFLDFGCGQGHVVKRATLQKPKISVGYDVVESERWPTWSEKPSVFTTNWEEVRQNGPYNIVLLYDVLDHITTSHIEELKKIRSVVAPNAKVFIRCHPFCSKHGTHLYQKLNKAYMHLVFNDEELALLGFENQKVHPVIHPIMVYEHWFKLAGFRNANKGPNIIREGVNPFFVNHPIISKRIRRHWAKSHLPGLASGKEFPSFQMEQIFLDFVLTP